MGGDIRRGPLGDPPRNKEGTVNRCCELLEEIDKVSVASARSREAMDEK